MIHLDTSFLVDLLRERKRKAPGPAAQLLGERLGEEELAISAHVACELFAGAELAASPSRERKSVQALLGSLHVIYPGEEFAPAYGRLLADLRRSGAAIAAMDLLIATAALRSEAPLVTRNVRHFSRIPGLELVEY